MGGIDRVSPARPCRVCGGSPNLPRGKGVRCVGFVTDDGYLHCTRDERAGALQPDGADPPTYAHVDSEDCRCGQPHVMYGSTNVVQLRRPRRVRTAGSWDIRDRAGRLLARHVRYQLEDGTKDFSWLAPDGTAGLPKDVRTADLLYGVETLSDDVQAVVLVEGEKSADALRQLLPRGAAVLGTVQGAHSQPSRAVLMHLRGRRVALWRDADEVGHGHMTRIAEALRDIAAEIRWVEWGSQPHDDAADFVERGGTADELKQLLATSTVMNAPEVVTVRRVGLGYEAESRDRWKLRLGRLHRTSQDVKGVLEVSDLGRPIAAGTFNVASLTTRTGWSKYLTSRTDGYRGWDAILEEFSQRVLQLDSEVEPAAPLTGELITAADEFLLAPILPLNDVTWLYGPPGSTKSYFAGLIALLTVTGVEVLGWTPRIGRVLVLDWESKEADWNDRLGRLARGLGVVPDWSLIRYTRAPRPLHEMQETVARWVAEQETRLVIIDSFGLAAGTSSERVAVEFTTTRLFECLRPLNTTVLVLDHVAKADKVNAHRNGTATEPIGSQYKLALARMGYELRAEDQPHPGQTEVVLRRAKVNRGRKEVVGAYRFAGFDSDAVTIESCKVTAPDLVAASASIADRLHQLLGEQGAMNIREIASALGCNYDAVRKTAERSPHRFRRLERGIYGLAAG